MPQEHIWHKCKKPCDGCMFCDGGLGLCEVCGGFEGQLLTTCPGYKLNNEALDACYHGNVKDFAFFRYAVYHGGRIKNGRIVWQ